MTSFRTTLLIAKMIMVNKRRFFLSLTHNILGILPLTMIRAIFQSGIIICCYNLVVARLESIYTPLLTVMLMMVLVVSMSVSLLFSVSDYTKIIDFHYWSSQSISQSALLVALIDARVFESIIDNIGFIAGVAFVLVPTCKLTIIFLIVFLILLVRMSVYYKFFNKQLSTEVRSAIRYSFSVCCVAVAAYFFFVFLYKLIIYTRVSVQHYGIGAEFITKTNDDVYAMIAKIAVSLAKFINEIVQYHPLFYLAAIVSVHIGVLMFRRILLVRNNVGAEINSDV